MMNGQDVAQTIAPSEQIAQALSQTIKEYTEREKSLVMQLDQVRIELSRLRGAYEGININRPLTAANNAIGAYPR